MEIKDRYARAVRSSKLMPTRGSDQADIDVLGAAGLAAKRSPLAVALIRLLSGDKLAAVDVVRQMAVKVRSKAHFAGQELTEVQAEDLSRQVLAWFRDWTCKPCCGRGSPLIPGTPLLSGARCPACHGTGKTPFERAMPRVHRDLSQWLRKEIEREVEIAGAAVMRSLAPKLDL